jgi:outer membrane protein insertion porin family
MKSMAKLLSVILGVQLLGVPLPAGQRPEAKPAQAGDPAKWPIREIRVEGAKLYTPQQVVEVSGLRPGDLATAQNFERARERILDSGIFESFGVRYEPLPSGGGFVVTIEISEPDLLYPWSIERLPISAADFAARAAGSLPLFGPRIPSSETYLLRASKLMEEMLAANGVKETVTARLLILGKDRLTLVFGPKAPPPIVTEVRFTGVRAIEPQILSKALGAVALGTPYLEPNFRLLLDSQIKPMYEAAGKLKVTFPKLTVGPSKRGEGVCVTVQVDEGTAYKLEKIDITGTPLSPQDLQDTGQFKIGQTIDYSEIGKGLNRIIEKLKAMGYLKVTYEATPTADEEKATISMLVKMKVGSEYKFGKLIIKGLDLESEHYLRTLWVMKPGEAFRTTYPDFFLKQVRDRRLFENLGATQAEVKLNEETGTADVVLIFKGGPSQPEKPKQEP